jgi:HK97 family phage major capsid protein
MSAVSLATPSLALGRYCKAIATAQGDVLGGLGFAEGQHAAWRDTPQGLSTLKSAVAALSSADAAGLAAAQVYDLLMPAVRSNELISRIPGLRRAPLNVSVPVITGDANAHLVAEGVAKPLSTFSLATITITPRKIVADICVTNELLRLSTQAADTALATELAKAATAQMDRQFANADFPNSIASGASTFNSTGSTLGAVDHDLAAMLDALAAGGDNALNNAVWIMSARAAVYLASLRGSGGNPAFPLLTAKGGSLLGLGVYTASGLNSFDSPSESQILLLDAAQILIGDSGEAAISIAKDADVQLSDAPSSPATSTVSLFASNLTVLRAERWCAWARQSTSSVIVLDNVQFG